MPTFILDEPHALDFHDILLVTRGRGTFLLDGVPLDVRPGRVLFTTPGQVRRWRVPKLDGLCLFFPALFLQEFFRDTQFVDRLPYFRHEASEQSALGLAPRPAATLRRQMLAMRDELQRIRPDSVQLLRAQLHEVLIRLARLYSAAHPAPAPAPVHPTVRRYQELIERHFRHLHRITDYTRKLSITAGHLNALCRKQLGRSAKQVLQDRIAVEARRFLLYTDRTAESIAQELGFADPSYFGRFFRRVSGMSPQNFRSELNRG
ncbi:MAG: helix-turn-helix domain-containing protein [Proteobacteria bacterium]|nr:helix-turn-helix domain-containing protein [Pseudomonadota bacterium]